MEEFLMFKKLVFLLSFVQIFNLYTMKVFEKFEDAVAGPYGYNGKQINNIRNISIDDVEVDAQQLLSMLKTIDRDFISPSLEEVFEQLSIDKTDEEKRADAYEILANKRYELKESVGAFVGGQLEPTLTSKVRQFLISIISNLSIHFLQETVLSQVYHRMPECTCPAGTTWCTCIDTSQRLFTIILIVSKFRKTTHMSFVYTSLGAGNLLFEKLLIYSLLDEVDIKKLHLNLIDIAYENPTSNTKDMQDHFKKGILSYAKIGKNQIIINFLPSAYQYINATNSKLLFKSDLLTMIDPGDDPIFYQTPSNTPYYNTYRFITDRSLEEGTTEADNASNYLFKPLNTEMPISFYYHPSPITERIITNLGQIERSAAAAPFNEKMSKLFEKKPEIELQKGENPFITFDDSIHFTLKPDGVALSLYWQLSNDHPLIIETNRIPAIRRDIIAQVFPDLPHKKLFLT